VVGEPLRVAGDDMDGARSLAHQRVQALVHRARALIS
jgi:hypothetical protein